MPVQDITVPKVTIMYLANGKVGVLESPWQPYLRVRHYIRQKKLIGMWLRTKATYKGSKKFVKLNEVPPQNSTIVMAPYGARI